MQTLKFLSVAYPAPSKYVLLAPRLSGLWALLAVLSFLRITRSLGREGDTQPGDPKTPTRRHDGPQAQRGKAARTGNRAGGAHRKRGGQGGEGGGLSG